MRLQSFSLICICCIFCVVDDVIASDPACMQASRCCCEWAGDSNQCKRECDVHNSECSNSKCLSECSNCNNNNNYRGCSCDNLDICSNCTARDVGFTSEKPYDSGCSTCSTPDDDDDDSISSEEPCNCKREPKCNNCQAPDDGSTSDTTIIVVSCAVVVVIIGILLTICYWIKRKDRNQRPPHSPKVKYAANGETIEVQGEPSVSTQPLPAIPVTNHYTLAESQNNTYEQIKPCYSSLKRNSNGSEDYTTLNKNVDVNASSAEEIEDKTMSSTNRDEVANTYAQLKNKPATEYTTPYLENEITPKQATPKKNDDYEDTEVTYDKLKHHACTRPNDDDISDDYNKLASVTAADGDLEGDYSHLDRTSKNLSSGVENQYSQLELTAANAADGTTPIGKTNHGYEDTWLSKTPENENPVMVPVVHTENDKNCAKESKANGGYEQAIINN